MKTLNDMLKAYLGGSADSEAALRRLRLYSKEDVGQFIAAIHCLAKLDVPVTPSFFSRGPGDRFGEIGRLARKIVRAGDDIVPTFDAASLARQPARVQQAYTQMLAEAYELAAALQVAGTCLGQKGCIHGEYGAVEQWERFCQYAHGHPGQEEKIRIAREQIAILSE